MMRTTISIAEDLYREAKELGDGQSFSDFASVAVQERLSCLKRTKLAQEMEEGYRAEAAASSLEPEWVSFEIEGL
jgi:predicted CopG family antitoxin